MTREELLAAIETVLGLRVERESIRSEHWVVSPTSGARLFTVSVYETERGWRFGGTGRLLSEQWTALVRLGMEESDD